MLFILKNIHTSIYFESLMSNVRKIWENSNMKENNLFLLAAAEKRFSFDEPMDRHTSFRAGGPADIFACPSSVRETEAFVSAFLSLGIPVFVLGGGSNVLFSDKGFRGAVVSTELLDGIVFETGSGILARCGSGCLMNNAVDLSVSRGFGGLERFAGLPGTVGGAAFMNARCYEISVSDVFEEADFLRFRLSGAETSGGDSLCRHVEVFRETKSFDSREWEYKKSPFNRRAYPGGESAGNPCSGDVLVLVSVVFRLSVGNRDFLSGETEKYRRDREEKGHFRLPSGGSVFKNNRAFGKPSGVIIDEAGLRGLESGGAMVAPWHGNIIVNRGNASAGDIRGLVEKVACTVKEKFGFSLEPEIIFAGDWE